MIPEPRNQEPAINRPTNLLERIHRSGMGPMLRTVASYGAVAQWKHHGSAPPAPPHIKRRVVSAHIARFQPKVFIETGTYRGDTLAAVRHLVQRTVSIELDESLCGLARARFRQHPDVEIMWGDSAIVLPELLEALDKRAVIWLDGHYSGGVTAGIEGVPVWSELTAALTCPTEHLVLIDDARLFDGTDGYPELNELLEMVSSRWPERAVRISDDIISIDP